MNTQFPYHYDPSLDIKVNENINIEILKYAGMYLLKKMDLSAEEGGISFSVPLEIIDKILEPILDHLFFRELIEINADKGEYLVTKKGQTYIDQLIEEAEGYIDQYQDFDTYARIMQMNHDGLNLLRVRFLWGLYDGEFDNFNQWQEMSNIDLDLRKNDWRDIICSKTFYDILFTEISEDLHHTDTDVQNQNHSNSDVLYSSSSHESDPNYFNPKHHTLSWNNTME